MKRVNFKDVEILKNVKDIFGIDARKLLENENLEIIHMVIDPNQKLEMHVNPVDVIFYVLEGKGTLLTENTELQVKKNDLIPCEKDIKRGWINENDEALMILVIKILKK